MPEREWRIVIVQLSDSFHHAISGLADGLPASLEIRSPSDDAPLPGDAGVVLVMAGGAETEGLDLLAELPRGEVPRYLVGALPDHRIAAAAVRRGAGDYFALPGDLGLLRRTLERDGREEHGRREAGRFATQERESFGFGAILGLSPTLRHTLAQAERVAAHRDVTVLIGGETGTGKELLARAIHYHGPRAAEPFVEVNCAAIPGALLESELFGHEKGAFTGATAAKPGLFELAHGGTLLLDEVGALPLELQPKLLRALEGRIIRRVGGQSQRAIDVRVIAATHLDLADAVARGEFREDLFYRLNVVALTLPPLRQRDGDVELLAEAFVHRLAAASGVPAPPLSAEVLGALRLHRWPGNVRELRNAIERALVLSPPGTLAVEHLGLVPAGPDAERGPIPFPADLSTLLRSAARAMLQLTGNNKSEAARRLGISRSRLQRVLDGVVDPE